MIVVRTVLELRQQLAPHRGGRIALVPTMGALHDGHLSLLRAARHDADWLVTSLFVNPKQFDDSADLARYPRQEARDVEMSAAAGADLLFAPTVEEVYPPGQATIVRMGGPADGHEGAHRPGHFDGVATVCLILFNMVQPHVAVFGQKDAQQVAVIQQLVRDLALPLEIAVHPTRRDPDGLAMSSRNVRLSPAERAQALAIPRALRAGLTAHGEGADPVVAAAHDAGRSAYGLRGCAGVRWTGHPHHRGACRCDPSDR